MIEFIEKGTGSGLRYVVTQDGRNVATIRAFHVKAAKRGERGYYCFYAETYTYDLRIGPKFGTLREIKDALKAHTFLTLDQEYEAACAAVENERRAYKAEQLSLKLAEAARDVVAGSNYAHEQLRELSDEIERFAKDRGDHEYNENHPINYPSYPEPPKVAA